MGAPVIQRIPGQGRTVTVDLAQFGMFSLRPHRVTFISSARDPASNDFAYEFLPAAGPAALGGARGGSGPNYAIFRVVAAPGVTVRPEGWPPAAFTPDSVHPLLEVFRVQDRREVPAQGTPIAPARYSSMANPQERGGQTTVAVRTLPDGAEFRRWGAAGVTAADQRDQGVRVHVDNMAGDQGVRVRAISRRHLTGGSRTARRPVVRILATRRPGWRTSASRSAAPRTTSGRSCAGCRPWISFPLRARGSRASARPPALLARSYLLSPACCSAWPAPCRSSGRCFAVAEYRYGARVRRDFHGRRLSEDEIENLAITAVLGLIGEGMSAAPLVARVAAMVGRAEREVAPTVRAIQALSAEERVTAREVASAIERGGA